MTSPAAPVETTALVPNYARYGVEFVSGSGCTLIDSEGREYLDLLAGVAVCNVGHCHPRVVAAVQEQVARLIHVSNLYFTEPMVRLAERLSARSLGGRVYFANSGAEAIEAAIKLARKARRGGEFVVVHGGFHGRTLGALSATPQESKQAPFAPLVPGFSVVPRDDSSALAAAVTDRTAAMLLEPIQGESGIHPLSAETLGAARAACDRHGALLILDEIQCGMGRTGQMWAWQESGVRPDVMTVAKGLGGGLPIGACLASPEHSEVLQPGDHGSTCAAGPVVAAAANAVLDVIGAEGFLDAVAARGEWLAHGLGDLGLEVRGRGLMLAFACAGAPDRARRLLTEQRLVVNATGPDTIRLLPPLIVSDSEIDEAVRRIAATLG